MADWIAVRGIAARGFHGVFAQEKRDGQRFFADVAYRLDTRPAALAHLSVPSPPLVAWQSASSAAFGCP